MSEDYSYLAIQTVADVNTFTLTVADSGGTSGSAGAYIPAFDIASMTNTALTLNAPSAGNVQILSLSQFTDSMTDTSVTITVPSNAIDNGAGKNNSKATKNPPSSDVFNVGGTTSSKINAAAISFSTNSNYGVYTLSGGLDVFTDIMFTLRF